MLFLGLIKKMGNFYFETLDDTTPTGNQWSSYPGVSKILKYPKSIYRYLVS